MKIRPVGAEMFHAYGQTGRHDETDSHFFALLRTRLKICSINLYKFRIWNFKNTASYSDQQELLYEIIYIISIGHNKHAYFQIKPLYKTDHA